MGNEILNKKMPSLLKSYFKAFSTVKEDFKKGDIFLNKNITCENIRVNPEHLKKYENMCGFNQANTLPLLYPQVISFPMHFHLLTDREFPIKLMGAVHYSNLIEQHEEIKGTDELKFNCFIGKHRILPRGIEFDLETKIFSMGKLLWQGLSTYLKRGNFGESENGVSEDKGLSIIKNPVSVSEWHIASNAGKKYALISGDFNPIHISAFLAKLFGFRRDIIHGMFALATCLSKNQGIINTQKDAVKLNVFFKGPVFINSNVNLKKSAEEKEKRYDLYCEDNPRPSISFEL